MTNFLDCGIYYDKIIILEHKNVIMKNIQTSIIGGMLGECRLILAHENQSK